MNKPSLHFKWRRQQLPLVMQEEITECGHACIAMISQKWGHALDLYSLRKLSQPSIRGMSLYQIKQLCEELGFLTRALDVPLQEVHFIQCPAILHWNHNHFVVLKKVTARHAIIHDPACGIITCDRALLAKSFTGMVLEITKPIALQPLQLQTPLKLTHLLQRIQGARTFLGYLLLLSVLLEGLNLTHPLFMQYLVDGVMLFQYSHHLYTAVIGFGLITLMNVFVTYLRQHMVIYLSHHLTATLTSSLVTHLLHLPLDFFEKRKKGDLQTKIQSIDVIQKKISTDFITTLLDGGMMVLNTVLLFLYSPAITGVILMSLFLFAGIRQLSYQTLEKDQSISIHQHSQALSNFLETLQGIVPIKSFLKEHLRLNQWRNLYFQALNADIRLAKMQMLYQTIQQCFFGMEYLLIIIMGAHLVTTHQLSLGMLLALLAYRQTLVTKAASVIHHIFDFKLIKIQLHRLNDITTQEQERLSSTGHPQISSPYTLSPQLLSAMDHSSSESQLPATYSRAPVIWPNTQKQNHNHPNKSQPIDRLSKPAISLHQLSFRYHPNDPPLFDNLNVTIDPGEKIVFVGPSGCGKTTLLKVMMGLLQPTTGDICIDNIPLHTLGLKSYRTLTAAVMQEDALLYGSIMDNIAFFDDNLDVIRVFEVAQMAHIHDDILRLPMGYETCIGDMGSTLSGGQKQRILLARALYKQPRFLFLDEATSHLDQENERRINQTIKALNITQISIAHRQETIRMADRVITLGGF